MRAMSQERQEPWPWKATWPLIILTLISTFNYLDRSLLGLAMPAIKQEMHVSDTVLGLISGLAFVVVYSLLGVPVAWVADRYNRRNIIAAGLAVWSLMTAFTGFVSNIWQLAMARFIMGAGESCGAAPSNSMLADYFPAGRRPLALAFYGLAPTLSFALFFPLAGWITEHHGWRKMFIAAGLPGVAIAILFLLTVREPRRTAGPSGKSFKPSASIMQDLKALFANRCFVWMFAGVTFMGANVWAAGAWTPTFFARVHNMGMAEASAVIGPSRGILGAIGVLAGGFIVDRLRRDRLSWRITIPALACAAVGPAEALFLLGDNKTIWVAGFAAASFFTLIHQGPIYAAVVNVVNSRRRALAISVILLGAGLIGNIVGPTAVGILNDALHPALGDHAIRYSMLVIAFTPIVAALCFYRAAAFYEDALAQNE
ncbi:MFS transporter [Altererythrobacter indicus]|uniref:MFS transporter n=1 Tax=Altericroceibacterium indicum TaxID=374177 RepID=A0A845AA18_9SPHN|nr:MFS transporter [Altericroceibacterium indicum]MXP26103.1 MFS transporter [Altericroceibacterium indicum]